MEPPVGTPMSKSDEELEIQALRRVISAYLDYPQAAEEDIRRWERSYSKLSPAHKALLPHLPKKYEDLRRCFKTNTYFIMNMLQAFDPPFEMDGAIGSDFDEPSHVDRKTADKIIHSHEGAGCCGRDDENTIDVHSYPSPSRDPAIISANSNKRQAVESSDLDSITDTSTPELNAFGTRGPVRSCDEWSCTRAEAEAKKHGAAAGANGHLSYDDTEYRSEYREGYENGHPIGSPKHLPYERVPLDLSHPSFQLRVPSADIDKVRCIVRNIVRDWGEEGSLEREQCYLPILEELHRLFPDRKDLRQRPTCLVPGAGLGRLACEISRLGFIAQGNEFSYYMLICSSFILNQSDQPLEWALHPWIHSNCNSLSDSDQLRAVHIPDLHPGSAGITEGFSMCAGDFVEVYSHPGQAGAWDSVVTCFFIDTAHNVVEYLEVIARALKPGGVWINLGPLLYHFAEAYSREEEMSLELSLEDVKKVAAQFGLVLKKERLIETTYTANCRSMMQNRYTAVFWIMVKEELAPTQMSIPSAV